MFILKGSSIFSEVCLFGKDMEKGGITFADDWNRYNKTILNFCCNGERVGDTRLIFFLMCGILENCRAPH